MYLIALINDHLRRATRHILDIGDMDTSARYLGNPLILFKNHYNDFFFLKENLLKRIEGWKTKFLSRAGRSTLIQVVTVAVPIYTLSSFIIPTRLCKEMDAINREFWWKINANSVRSLKLVSWSSICQPEVCEGVGFRKFEDMNLALVAKLAWNLVCPGSSLAFNVL